MEKQVNFLDSAWFTADQVRSPSLHKIAPMSHSLTFGEKAYQTSHEASAFRKPSKTLSECVLSLDLNTFVRVPSCSRL